jgi:hypothetical protein
MSIRMIVSEIYDLERISIEMIVSLFSKLFGK